MTMISGQKVVEYCLMNNIRCGYSNSTPRHGPMVLYLDEHGPMVLYLDEHGPMVLYLDKHGPMVEPPERPN